ncbi:2Fe-2S iron-sulfur cluster-binding protein [Chloroflexota bacterium]
MVTLTIDEREVQAQEGTMILDVAKENNIYIPSLCTNDAVSPYGACRLCLVEVTKGKRDRLVASCLYPVEKGLIVKTNSERIMANRRAIMELLLARCPNVSEIQDLARRLGVKGTPFALEDKKCILCALCVRACQEVVGVSAISLVNRGINRELSTPFYEPSKVCIGCGSCAYICPTEAIQFEDIEDTRFINWPNNKMEFKLKKCKSCGNYWAPEKQIDHIAKQSNLDPEVFDVCPNCRD